MVFLFHFVLLFHSFRAHRLPFSLLYFLAISSSESSRAHCQWTGQLNEGIILLPQSFSSGAEFQVTIPRKICSCMPSCKTQKGDPNLYMSFLKPFGDLLVVLRTKTKLLLEDFQALQIWLLFISLSFQAHHTPATLTFCQFFEHVISSAKNRPLSHLFTV